MNMNGINIVHRSDCALHNGPALPKGECDCEPLLVCQRCGDEWAPEVCRDLDCPRQSFSERLRAKGVAQVSDGDFN